MIETVIFLSETLVYAGMIFCYLKLAEKLHLFDTPDHRSSHIKITITGAGIIFPVAVLLPLVFTGQYIHYRATLTGLFLISGISLLDDLKTVPPKWRAVIHVIAVGLLLWQTGGLFSMKLWQLLPAFILVVGIINAYNFMDGINGITAFYSLTAFGTIFFLKTHGFSRLPASEVFISLIASIAAFAFFNARKKAICFSGDVGSISIAFILSLLIMQLMIADDSAKWILLIGIYGLDSVGTIILRIIRRENILEPHRSHFYQYLVNEKKLSHVSVSLLYAVIQLGLNYIVITQSVGVSIIFFLLLVLLYIILRLNMEGSKKLFKDYAQ